MLTASGLPVRKRIRLRDHDYGGGCAYYVTICTYQRSRLFGRCESGVMTLSAIGSYVKACWLETEIVRSDVLLDEFTIMPDHMHAILHLLWRPGDQAVPPWRKRLFRVIGGFKSGVTSAVRAMRGDPNFEVWQPRFNDRILRSDEELEEKREYIRANPTRWCARGK